MKTPNIYLVIPTIRSLDFLKEWGNQFADCHLLIIEDHKSIEIPTPKGNYRSVDHYTWEDIQQDFGTDEWIFPRFNAGIRSYGFWKAYKKGADIIITIDDDCFPVEENFVTEHVKNLELKAPQRWINTYPHRGHIYTRGFPYSVRNSYPVMISHGLWTNQIDHDAQTQLSVGTINLPLYPSLIQFIPFGFYFPMCSMNLAFRREITPLMYFPLMGSDQYGKPWGYDRFDDIWAGIFAKKICDHLQYGVVNGSPFVDHRKASDPQKNKVKEASGIKANEKLWEIIDMTLLHGTSINKNYIALAKALKNEYNDEYFRNLAKAMEIWVRYF